MMNGKSEDDELKPASTWKLAVFIGRRKSSEKEHAPDESPNGTSSQALSSEKMERLCALVFTSCVSLGMKSLL